MVMEQDTITFATNWTLSSGVKNLLRISFCIDNALNKRKIQLAGTANYLYFPFDLLVSYAVVERFDRLHFINQQIFYS